MAEKLTGFPNHPTAEIDWSPLIAFVDETRAAMPRPHARPASLRVLVRALINRCESAIGPELELLEALASDIETYTRRPGHRFDRVKALVNEGRIPVLLSVFDAPYFEGLGFDALAYERVRVDGALVSKYSTNVVPIRTVRASRGFHPPHVVALFPENHLDRVQLAQDRIFYVIDKFIDRFNRITRPLLDIGVVPGTLERLRGIDDASVERCAAYWVWLHEYFHRQGALPLPAALDIKSFRPLAGLEECRVDMLGLLVLLRDEDLPCEERLLAADFILAERLLRYAIEGIPSPNYDAIGSQILFNFLRSRGSLRVVNGRMELTSRLEEGLLAFVNEVHRIESGVETMTRQDVKHLLIAFSKDHTNYDHATQQYRHDPMFVELARRIRSDASCVQ